MSLSKVANATRLRAAAALPLLALLLACGEKEWEEKSGTLELYASPLPPVAGQALTLGVLGTNVGPVDVFQGEQRIATLVNVDTTKRVDLQVIAVSSAVPKAVAVAYDFKRLEAQAAPFTTQPSVPDGGLVDAGPRDAGAVDASPVDAAPPFVEDCPGLVSLASPTACNPETVDTIAVDVRNDRPNTVAIRVYAAPDGGTCLRVAGTALFNGNQQMRAELQRGATVEFVDRGATTAFRTVRLPSQGPCAIRLSP